jgi:HPr kinase/phosphorylase
MTDKVTAQLLFETHKHRLLLQWAAGHAGKDREIRPDETLNTRLSLIGHLNAIHPNQIQVLGGWELEYLSGLGKNSYNDLMQRLFGNTPAAIIVANGLQISDDLRQRAEQTGTPLFSSPVNSQKLINRIQYDLNARLAETTIIHGVFMEVHGLGVLLTGESGIGKSELALDLISRGHRLIADDAPEFSRISPDTVRGNCPEVLRDFLEVRGLGILNIREMFGDSAIKPAKNLRLIVKLILMDGEQIHQMERLTGSYRNFGLLDVEIPEVIIPVAPGRSLAVLVEAATRQHLQLLSGYNAAEDFIQKQQQLIHSQQQ